MTAALASALAVAVLLAAAGWFQTRRAGASAAAEARRAQRAEADLERSRAALRRVEDNVDGISEALAGLRARAMEAEIRADRADARATEADARATEAEARAAEADARAAQAAERAAVKREAPAETTLPAEATGGAARCLWALERLRAVREWADVAGPGADLPVEWNGSLAAAVGVELAVIREVIGTPSEITSTGTATDRVETLASALAARLSAEVLRTLGRAGDEMVVSLDGNTMTVELPPDTPRLDLALLSRAAEEAGGRLVQDGNRTALTFAEL